MTARHELVVSGGRMVTPEGVFEGSLGVDAGIITEISTGDLKGHRTIEARGRMVFPGVVDLHVHFSEPGRGHWEGWAHGSRAAAAGGVTTVIEMPLNAVPATVNLAALEAKLTAARASSLVDFALWGGLVDDNLADLDALCRSGVVGIKAFMVDIKDESFRFVEGRLLDRGMDQVARSGLFLGLHAEDNRSAWDRMQTLKASGRVDRPVWNQARSPEVELAAIQTALAQAQRADCPLHIVHVSLPEGIDAINAARARGQRVTAETCGHYLTLTDEDFYRIGPEAKCAPPLRDRARLEGLWDRVLAGEIDCLTSDHSPCPTEDKLRGTDDIWKAWGGINGIQVLLPLILDEGIHKRHLPWEQAANLLSINPARIAGIDGTKGGLRVGVDADVVLIDPDRRWTVTEDALLSRHRHSAFVGKTLRGGVDTVLRRGEVIVQEGTVANGSGGRWIRRPIHE